MHAQTGNACRLCAECNFFIEIRAQHVEEQDSQDCFSAFVNMPWRTGRRAKLFDNFSSSVHSPQLTCGENS